MILAPNFKLEEFLRSASFPDLAGGIHDTPPAVLLTLSRLAFTVLVPMRERFGRLVITSAFRPRALNAAVIGSDSSKHLTGAAADFVLDNYPSHRAWEEICNGGIPWNWDRLAYYTEQNGRFHVDINAESENQRGLLFEAGAGGWRAV